MRAAGCRYDVDNRSCGTPMAVRKRSRPRRMRPLTVPIGAALTTTMRRTPVAFIAWTIARVPCDVPERLAAYVAEVREEERLRAGLHLGEAVDAVLAGVAARHEAGPRDARDGRDRGAHRRRGPGVEQRAHRAVSAGSRARGAPGRAPRGSWRMPRTAFFVPRRQGLGNLSTVRRSAASGARG